MKALIKLIARDGSKKPMYLGAPVALEHEFEDIQDHEVLTFKKEADARCFPFPSVRAARAVIRILPKLENSDIEVIPVSLT